MKKKFHKNSWRKLDNTAKIFSLDDKRNTNIFRYSVLLKENVDTNILKEALSLSLEDFPDFKVKIGMGFFWNYLEFNFKKPIIEKERQIPCQHFDFKRNNNYLFKVTYYKNKINIDMFHVLTDGTGANLFFKNLIYHYLGLKYNLPMNKKVVNNNSSSSDKYLKYYDDKYKMMYDFKPAYQIPGIANKRKNNTYHYIININELKKVCKGLNVTITEYLTAVYMYAIYLSLYNKKSNKEISITVPINLRKHFNDETMANFFTYMNVISDIKKKEDICFSELLKHIRNEFKEKLTNKKIKEYLARDVNLGMNLPIRLVPLFIKKLFIKFMGMLVSKSSTTTLSNVGIMQIDDEYKQFIDNILVMVMPGRIQKIKCTICSFNDKLNITINSNINDANFQKTFLGILKKDINKVQIESNIKIKRKRRI